MKAKSSNATVNYDPVRISDKIHIDFTLTTVKNNATIYGKLMVDETQGGDISYDRQGNYLTIRFKPRDLYNNEDVDLLLRQVQPCLCEILGEELPTDGGDESESGNESD